MEEEKTYCKFCGKELKLDVKKSQKNKHYCSVTCRSYFYEKRNKDVIEMFNSGEDVLKICAKHGIQACTIKHILTMANVSYKDKLARQKSRTKPAKKKDLDHVPLKYWKKKPIPPMHIPTTDRHVKQPDGSYKREMLKA